MQTNYSAERNVQILVFLLKKNNIKKVVVSPGATNVCFVASLQCDSFFEMYSCVDERSAAYMAVGIAAETGEPVVLSCTGATSSRNYMPALTEAYYRKLPIIAVTSSMDNALVGHLWAQVTDRSQKPNDVVKDSIYAQNIRSENDEWDCTIKINYILQLVNRVPYGPVHINIATGMGGGYGVKELPKAKYIKQYTSAIDLPKLPSDGNIGIFIGEHRRFTSEEIGLLDTFCEAYDAVVFCDHTSNYYGKYRFMYSLIGAQDDLCSDLGDIRLLIHIGEISGDYDTLGGLKPREVWRVNEDGAFRDRFHKLSMVYTMPEKDFFGYYTALFETSKNNVCSYFKKCEALYDKIYSKIGYLPLSNIFIAKELAPKMPFDSVLYLGILNTLRSWNFFKVAYNVQTYSNVGGFGIDGIMSSMIGSSFVNPNKIHFAILGDLSFFYDLNCLGNRHIKSNIRILLINNGHGQEFANYTHAASVLGDGVNEYVAARGHFGSKSVDLVNHFANDLGFEYISACTTEDFLSKCSYFIDSEIHEKPLIFEVFTTEEDENLALKSIHSILSDSKTKMKHMIKRILF